MLTICILFWIQFRINDDSNNNMNEFVMPVWKLLQVACLLFKHFDLAHISMKIEFSLLLFSVLIHHCGRC